MEFIKKRKILLSLILVYMLIMVSVIDFGIPNPSHPFTYHMDEWHQLMAVRSLFSQGTSNVLGAANGPILFFLISGIFLGPFYLLGIIDPFAITSSISALEEQQKLFIVMRLTSLVFGIGSIVLVWEIAKRFLKIDPLIPSLFFICTPIWIMLSNYFKYDIALVFFILLSLYFFFWFSEKPTRKRFLLTGISIGCALGVKISALPLLPVYLLAYFLFSPSKNRSFVTLFYGLCVVGGTFFLIGVPDSIISWKAYYEFFYLNIISGPKETANYLFPSVWQYLLTHVYPLTFGHGVYSLFLIAFGYFLFLFLQKKERNQHKKEFLLVLLLLVFIVSLISLKIQAIGNRIVVILPLMALLIGIFWERMLEIKNSTIKKVWVLCFIIAFVIQIIEVSAWLQMKYGQNPRYEASMWMQKYLPGQTIGLENIPIYQQIPDISLKEFYLLQDNPKAKTTFFYEVIDAKTAKLPKTIIITNGVYEMVRLKQSPKKDLLSRMQREGYKEIQQFTPSWSLYQMYAPTIDMPFLALVPLMPISFYQK